MPRFTRHACIRYLLRCPGLLDKPYNKKISLTRVEERARVRFAESQFVSRAAAAARVGPIAPRGWNYYYRLEPSGGGVWITSWKKGEEVVITYLYPKPARGRKFLRKKLVDGLGLPRKRLAVHTGSLAYVGTILVGGEEPMLVGSKQEKRCDWHAVRPRPAPVKVGRHGGSGSGPDSGGDSGVLQRGERSPL